MATCHYRAHRRSGSRWRPFKHSLREVQERFIENIMNLEEHETNRFHNMALSDLSFQCSYTNPENRQLLYRYFNIFNRMFFFNALDRNVCTLRIICKSGADRAEWQANFEAPNRLSGYASSSRSGPLNRQRICKIIIYEKCYGDAEYCLKSYIETLLHEMIHAFIRIYTCCCPSCTDSFAQQYGQEGHGETWHAMATVLEEVVIDKLGINVVLGIADGMAEEWYLTEADLQDVDLGNLDYDDIVQRVDQFYFENGSPR